MEDGCVPGFSVLLEAVFRVQEVNTICKIEKSLNFCNIQVVGVGGRLLVHCYGGLGRTCLVVACYLLGLDSTLAPEAVIAILRSHAILKQKKIEKIQNTHSVLKYWYLQEFERAESCPNCETVQHDYGVQGTSWSGRVAAGQQEQISFQIDSPRLRRFGVGDKAKSCLSH